jgi:hypothetical protein
MPIMMVNNCHLKILLIAGISLKDNQQLIFISIYYNLNNLMKGGIFMWKDIIGFEGYYQINEYGKVKRFSRQIFGKNNSIKIINETILSDRDNGKGYRVLELYKDNIRYFKKIHRLVAEAFVDNPKPDEYNQVNHIDGNKSNNYYKNLEWCNNQENCKHRNKLYNNKNIENATLAKMIPCAKVDLKTGEILEKYNSYKEAAKKNGFNKDYISQCARGKLKKYKNFKWIKL